MRQKSTFFSITLFVLVSTGKSSLAESLMSTVLGDTFTVASICSHGLKRILGSYYIHR